MYPSDVEGRPGGGPFGDLIFAFVEKANRRSNQIRQDDIDGLKQAGWSDEAIYDAVTVCALFRFYNVCVDATGVHEMPAEAHAMSGRRLATRGYVPGDVREKPAGG